MHSRQPLVTASSPGTPHTYAAEVARLDREIAFHEERARHATNAWTPRETLAQLCAERARLTGDFADYRRAETALAAAYAISGDVAGPHMTRAQMAFTLHRLDEASVALDRAARKVILTDPERAAIEGLRADIALSRGEYHAARDGFEHSQQLHPTFEGVCRLAIYHGQVGDVDTAERLYRRAATMPEGALPLDAAWIDLQLGLLDLDRDRVEKALAHYRDAERHFSGWWLVEEHIAEALARLGDTAGAVRIYRELVERTKNPELMNALSALVEPHEAATLRRAADAAHRSRMRELPEAAIGHALDFYLEHSTDTTVFLALAERNYALRPGGDASVALARAYEKAGRAAEAQALVERVLATPYRSSELRNLAARLCPTVASQEPAIE
jgi:tetratricopeptide (TPR) repeat protein